MSIRWVKGEVVVIKDPSNYVDYNVVSEDFVRTMLVITGRVRA